MRGPTELRAGWRLCIFLAIDFALIKVCNPILPLLSTDDSVLYLLRDAIGLFACFLATWTMGYIEGRTITQYGLPWRGMFRGHFWLGILLGFASITALLMLMRLAGVLDFGTIALHGAEVGKWAAVYAFVFVLVALKEEFFNRGYVLFTLTTGIGFWPAAIVSSAVFAYGHYGNSAEDAIGLVNAAGFGLLACLLLRRMGSLWMPIGLHVAFDWGETYFYGVPDSGHVLPGHLFTASAFGPAWLSGGSVGPEGSVPCSVVIALLGLIGVLGLRQVKYPSKAQPAPMRHEVLVTQPRKNK